MPPAIPSALPNLAYELQPPSAKARAPSAGRTPPDDVLTSIASHLTDFCDVRNFDRAFFPRIPGIYASLEQGKVLATLLPLLPDVRSMHGAHPALAARELPAHLPDWELRFLLHVGAPQSTLAALPFAELDALYTRLRGLTVAAPSPLLRQVGGLADRKFLYVVFRATMLLSDFDASCRTRRDISLASFEELRSFVGKMVLRYDGRAEAKFADTLTQLGGVVVQQNMRELPADRVDQLRQSMARSREAIFEDCARLTPRTDNSLRLDAPA